MTLQQKIGQMLVLGWGAADDGDSTVVNSHAREIVQESQVGGVVLLGRNVADDLRITARTLNELQAMSEEPLFIISDQEGGMVARFIDNVTLFASNMALGAAGDPELAYKAAVATAEELMAIGVNYNFAPTVDVNNNADNPIIGTRSYGESPDRVAEFAVRTIRGYQDSGLIACTKHFPGHGDTAVDSHLALPTVPYERHRLDEIELKPFRATIAAGLSTIMTTHIMFPAFDTQRPATLSKNVITGLLRNEMGFKGVVVTDCMEMKAIADNFGTPEACVMAIEAGVDLVLVCHTRATQQAAREAILQAVESGRIPESRIDESVSRIRALKQQYSLDSRRAVNLDALETVLRSKDHLSLQQEIARRSVTLVRNEQNTIPLRLAQGKALLVAGLHQTVTPLAVALREHYPNVKALHLQGDGADIISRALEAAATSDAIIVPTCPREPWRTPVDQELQARLVNTLYALGKPLVVVAVREPYDLRRFPQVSTYVCTYGYRGGSLEAAAEVISGAIPPQGRLPVTIPLDGSSPITAASSADVMEEYF